MFFLCIGSQNLVNIGYRHTQEDMGLMPNCIVLALNLYLLYENSSLEV